MSTPIQVTEAHRALARRIMFEHTPSGLAQAQGVLMAAQLIADSEAKATAELRAEAERLKDCAFDKDGTPWKTVCGWWSAKYDAAERQMSENAARASRAETELTAERARLDWLMAGGVCMIQHTGGFHVSRLHAPVSRAAIDAAMKEGAK